MVCGINIPEGGYRVVGTSDTDRVAQLSTNFSQNPSSYDSLDVRGTSSMIDVLSTRIFEAITNGSATDLSGRPASRALVIESSIVIARALDLVSTTIAGGIGNVDGPNQSLTERWSANNGDLPGIIAGFSTLASRFRSIATPRS